MKHYAWPSTLMALLLLVACVLGGSSVAADAPRAQLAANDSSVTPETATTVIDIAGDYAVVGTNEDGSRYKGTLKVIKHGAVYQFRWHAGQQYDGIGVPNGNVVAVAFTGGGNGEGCGVVSYHVLADGTLDGKWGYWGVNDSGTEKATHTSGSGFRGDYNVTGTNPDGTAYRAQLTVTPKGSGYTFVWSNNSAGFGIRHGNNVSVGIGGARCAFVAYEIKPDGVLDGVWGGYGSDKTGTEQATKQ